jgi:hypothetical protein
MKTLFRSLQDQLIANLKGTRSVFSHSGAKGEASETDWIAMLKAHLPKRYSIDKAFVVDCSGSRSEEIDIVIYDWQYTPVLYNHKGQLFIPAESVYAVLEVKQSFNKFNLEYAGVKASSVRRLERTSTAIPYAGGRYEPRQLPPILSGILAYESEWNPPLGDSFEVVIKKFTESERLDLGCAVSSGSFEAKYLDNGDVEIVKTGASVALISFFLNLLKRLQDVGTAPAIDYDRYVNTL